MTLELSALIVISIIAICIHKIKLICPYLCRISLGSLVYFHFHQIQGVFLPHAWWSWDELHDTNQDKAVTE